MESTEFDHVEAALPNYKITNVIGRGAYAVVLAGEHRRLNRPVAIKILAVDPYDDGHDGHDSQRRFLTEAQLLGNLDHAHIVRVYDYVERGDLRLLVMERLEDSLRARARSGLPADAVVAVG